jgi:hypothetical protein
VRNEITRVVVSAKQGDPGTTDYNELENLPTLGTASALDVSATGDAADAEIVLGSDSRLDDARTPISHVHAIGDVTDLQGELDDIDDAFAALGTASVLDVPVSPGAAASSSQAVRGDDPRLSDARSPTSHGHADTEITSTGTGWVGTQLHLILIAIKGVTDALTSGLASLVGTVAALTSSSIANASTVVGTLVTDALNTLGSAVSTLTSGLATVVGTVASLLAALRMSSSTGSSAALHLYLSAANGSDASFGLSSATPVASWARLMALFPLLRFGPVVLHIGAGTYSWVAVPASIALGANCPVYLLGDGASQAGEDGFTVIATRTAGAASTITSIVDTPASANLYTGYTLEWAAGTANAGRRCVVRNNTTAAVVPTCRGVSAPTTATHTGSLRRPARSRSLAPGYLPRESEADSASRRSCSSTSGFRARQRRRRFRAPRCASPTVRP